VLVFALINCVGLRVGKRVQNSLSAAKLAGLFLLTVLIFMQARPFAASAASLGAQTVAGHWTMLGAALVSIVWTFDGWSYLSFSGAEVKEPGRTLPRAFFYGTAIVIVLYLGVNIGYYSILSATEIRDSDAVVSAAAIKLFGDGVARFVSLLIGITIVGSLNAMFLTAPRCLTVMSRDGVLPLTLGRVHPHLRTPVAAILAQAGLGAGFVVLGGFYQLLAMAVAAAWSFNIAIVFAVFVLRRRNPARARPYSVPGYPWIPALFCTAAAGIITSAVISEPRFSALGALLIASGIPVYWMVGHPQRGLRTDPEPSLVDL
jgi:APA family basic amino acid/polyamine antiporter